jgi:hypothetical protein
MSAPTPAGRWHAQPERRDVRAGTSVTGAVRCFPSLVEAREYTRKADRIVPGDVAQSRTWNLSTCLGESCEIAAAHQAAEDADAAHRAMLGRLR